MYLQYTWQWAMPGTNCLVVDGTHPSVMRMPQSLLPFMFHSVVVNRAISWQRWSNRGIPRRPVDHSTYASGMIHWILATAFSFSGSMVRISSILEFGCSLIIGQSRGRTMSLDDGSLPHQIHHLWQRKRSKKKLMKILAKMGFSDQVQNKRDLKYNIEIFIGKISSPFPFIYWFYWSCVVFESDIRDFFD